MADKIFTDGFYFNEKREGAPDFVLGSVSILPEKFVAWLQAQPKDAKGYVRLSIKKSQKGSNYAELDTWEPKEKVEPAIQTADMPSVKMDKVYAKVSENAPNPEDVPF